MKADPQLLKFYEDGAAEGERLSRREGRLEFARTKELLLRFLPKPPARIIDVGGGTGPYAAWLASEGHDVRLVDVVPAHVEEASRVGTFAAAVGDARALPDPDATFDAALLLGPLYHLQDKEDRLRALREAGRVVRPGGLVAAAFISRGAVALDGYVKGWIDKPGVVGIMRAQMRGGFSRNDRGGFGPISYFHSAAEARLELAASGLDVLATFGVEGPGWVAPDFEERWADAQGREVILESARMCEEDPELLTLSAHLLGVCRRP